MDFSKIAMRKKRILYTDALTLLAATTVRIVSTTNGHILQRKQNKSNWNPLLCKCYQHTTYTIRTLTCTTMSHNAS